MCGIAGWIDYDRNLEADRSTVEMMTETMSLRGPDAGGVWISGPAALGHRRLSVIDLVGGKQPMEAIENNETIACLTYSGEVYNFVELRDELKSYGHHFKSRSDTEVVLRGYLEWGDKVAERLVGIFAFAIWDVRKRCLFLVRDRLGVKPLFYQPTDAGLLFGSEPKAILAHPDVPVRVGIKGLQRLLTTTPVPGEALYEDMYEVPPGYVIRVSTEGLAKRRYWALEAREHKDSLRVTIQKIRTRLDEVVQQQTVSDVPLCSLLSGGLDSSLVTALANKAVQSRSKASVRSFSVDFSDNTAPFVQDFGRDLPDTPFVRDFVAQLKTDHTEVMLNSERLKDENTRRAVMRALDCGWPAGGDMFPSLYLLFEEIRKDSTVALSGESADEVFGGYRWFHEPAMVEAEDFPWNAMLPTLAPLVCEDVARELRLDEYRKDCYSQAIRDTPCLAGETGLQKRMREISYLNLTRFLPILLDRKDRMSMAVGLEVRVPFCDHELVDYVFNTPWSMKTFDGREKSLLRAAASGLLPDSILQRRKSPYPSTQDPGYERALRLKLTTLLDDNSAPMNALFDKTALRGFLDKPLTQVSLGSERSQMDGVLAVNDWMDDYDVRLVVGEPAAYVSSNGRPT
jgi:asparagine synthase (glutamine-hydrolysing)